MAHEDKDKRVENGRPPGASLPSTFFEEGSILVAVCHTRLTDLRASQKHLAHHIPSPQRGTGITDARSFEWVLGIQSQIDSLAW